MPLPQRNTAWPPTETVRVMESLRQWSAWYDGTPEALREAYGRGVGGVGGVGGIDARVDMIRAQQHHGLRRLFNRMWWGRPLSESPLQRDMLHVPIAADLCQASADLLFADQPTFKVEQTETQKRLDELADDGLYSTLAEAAEVAAALGGVYLRVTWDKTVQADAPFLTAVHADAAIPVFKWGRLTEVTFWEVVSVQGQTVWRHLERHSLDTRGFGIIEHTLYEGSFNNIGNPASISALPATAVYVEALNADGVISTESPGLAVTYVPNQRPQRRWRTDPHGAPLGRSDLDGVEPLMDALDEVYSSWMRDIRLGKARIMIAKSMLENFGPGAGATFDAEQEVYSPVNALMNAKDTKGLPIEQVQFEIRYKEHQATAQQLVENIVRTAGYSTQTFGEGGEITPQRTATEVDARKERSLLTRDRKIRLWKPAIADALKKLLAVDVALFAGRYPIARPDVSFPPGVQDTQLSIAQTALALRNAEAASTETIVRLVNPEWDDQQVEEEAAKIVAEKATATVPPNAPPLDPNAPVVPPVDPAAKPGTPVDQATAARTAAPAAK